MSGKIHRATVTLADLDNIGSVSNDKALLDASGEVCINGAAAHLVQPGDIVIILSYAEVEEENIGSHTPRIVLVNSENKISEIVSSESNF